MTHSNIPWCNICRLTCTGVEINNNMLYNLPAVNRVKEAHSFLEALHLHGFGGNFLRQWTKYLLTHPPTLPPSPLALSILWLLVKQSNIRPSKQNYFWKFLFAIFEKHFLVIRGTPSTSLHLLSRLSLMIQKPACLCPFLKNDSFFEAPFQKNCHRECFRKYSSKGSSWGFAVPYLKGIQTRDWDELKVIVIDRL